MPITAWPLTVEALAPLPRQRQARLPVPNASRHFVREQLQQMPAPHKCSYRFADLHLLHIFATQPWLAQQARVLASPMQRTEVGTPAQSEARACESPSFESPAQNMMKSARMAVWKLLEPCLTNPPPATTLATAAAGGKEVAADPSNEPCECIKKQPE